MIISSCHCGYFFSMNKMAVIRLLSVCLCLASLATADDHGSYLHDPKNVHNAEHIKQHMGEYFNEDEDIAEQLKLDDNEAMEFHYFKLHDYDNNNKLDGHELGVAMTHFHAETSDEGNEGETPTSYSIGDEELATLIDMILKEDDLNDDGYVDYYEFVQASRRGSQAGNDQKDNL